MTTLAWFDTALLTRIVLTFGHFLWQGAAIALIVLALPLVFRKSTARPRYVMLLGSLSLMTICPVVTFCFVQTGELGPVLTQTNEPILVGESDTLADKTVAVENDIVVVEPGEFPDVATSPDSTEQLKPDTSEAHAGNYLTNVGKHAGSRWQWAVPYLTVVYLLGVVLLLSRLLLGLHGGRRLRRQAQIIDEPKILSGIARSARRLGLQFTPTVLYCKQVAIPTVVGLFRPAILLPLSLTSGLSPDQVEAILTHELAHVRRYDHVVNILQRVIESLLFFHPAVWWVSHRIRVERENCCDDIVVILGTEPLRYAASLVDIAERGQANRPSLQLETVAALHAAKGGSQLSHRVKRLVGGSSSETLRLSRGGHILALLCLAIIVSGAALLQGQTESDGRTETPKEDDPKNSKPNAVFGPVLERTLSFGEDKSKPFLRLETGKLIAKPAGLDLADEEAVLGWMKENDVEIGLVKTRGELHLVCSNLPTYSIEPEAADRYWNRMTADEFVAISRNWGAGFVDFESRHFVSLSTEKTPITLYLPARGLLQGIEPETGDSATLKIRYKLVSKRLLRQLVSQSAVAEQPTGEPVDAEEQVEAGETPSKAQPAKAAAVKSGAGTTKNAYIPAADSKGRNVILDLASGKMLPMPKERTAKGLTLLGKGDLAYESKAIICLRGATARIWKKDRFAPLAPTEQEENITVVPLPSVLPCRLLVTTAEKLQFDVTIQAVTSNGGLVVKYHAAATENSKPRDADHEHFLGSWKVLSARENGREKPKANVRLIMHPDHFQFLENDKEGVSGSYTIDSSRNPKTIDLVSENGTLPMMRAIYEFPRKGIMRICFRDNLSEGLKERPTSFDFKPGDDGLTVLELQLETNGGATTPKQSDRDNASQTVYVPSVNSPGKNVVLDLASGDMLPMPKNKPSAVLTRFGKGDLVYEEGGLICTRGATATIWNKNRFVLLAPFIEKENSTAYKLPNVPCRLLVTTAEKKQYDVAIQFVSSIGGILLKYEEVAKTSTNSAATKTDHKRLKVSWKVLSVKKDGVALPKIDGKYVFHADRFQIFHNGEEAVSGTYAIDASSHPKTIDLRSLGQSEFPAIRGIYDFPGPGRMRICYGDKQNWRPTSFESKQDGGSVAVVELQLETNDASTPPKNIEQPEAKPDTSSNEPTKTIHLQNAEGGPGATFDEGADAPEDTPSESNDDPRT
jgi:uncharacterized protein (TIGR03067 family)